MEQWLNQNTLFASLIWGSIGVGMFIYGKKQGAMWPLIGGIALVAISYVLPDWLWMSLASVGVIAGVWFLAKRFG